MQPNYRKINFVDGQHKMHHVNIYSSHAILKKVNKDEVVAVRQVNAICQNCLFGEIMVYLLI